MMQVISNALKSQIERIVEEEAKEAAKRVEDRVRGSTGDIAARVLNHFSMEKYGSDIRITVHFPEMKN